MKATGITAEFDPLHNGHAYLMAEARRITGCDAVVVAMSGDFVQRGEPALTDKWSRTRVALGSGADLVIEIPVQFCLGNASQYAKASVSLLEAAGCSRIAFGSETGDTALIERTAGNIRGMDAELASEISVLAREGLSYPKARERAYAWLRKNSASGDGLERELSVLRGANDILALEYVLAMKKAVPLAVKRKGACHSDGSAEGNDMPSATAIRRYLYGLRSSEEDPAEVLSAWMPEASVKAVGASPLTFREDWTAVLRYAVMSSDPSFIEDCPSGGEGLANLLKSAAAAEDSYDGIIKAVKSRRYTYTRISRLCMQLILGISRTKYPYDAPLYIRVLGFTDRGRALLAEMRKSVVCSLPVITNINKETGGLSRSAMQMLELDVHASDVYDLVTGRSVVSSSDHVMRPVMFC